MKNFPVFTKRILLFLLQPLFFFQAFAYPFFEADTSAPGQSALQYIDPTIGNIGRLLEPTRPTAQLPNQLIRVYPIRKDYLDDRISGFPLTAVSHRLGEVFSIKPSIAPPDPEEWNRQMPYDHDLEITRPWYYSTYLIRDGITVEFAPGKKTGYYRFTFPPGKNKSILLSGFNDGESTWHFLSSAAIEGTEIWHGDIKIYMYGEFSAAGSPEISENGQLKNGTSVSGKTARVRIGFAAAIASG